MTNLSSYQDVSAHGALADASSHEVITQMYRTALTRIAEAKGSIERGETGRKGEQIGKALAIVEGLLMSLDGEQGGEIAENLTRLYDYMARNLVKANLEDDAAALDEISGLIRELKDGWEAIPVELRT
ncbi:MAG: flagellar export chaperone FliS [Gammaproteobacteria bacterium]|nr:flagellar export chaperone FliS [Gammaproteobacteria bacterium]